VRRVPVRAVVTVVVDAQSCHCKPQLGSRWVLVTICATASPAHHVACAPLNSEVPHAHPSPRAPPPHTHTHAHTHTHTHTQTPYTHSCCPPATRLKSARRASTCQVCVGVCVRGCATHARETCVQHNACATHCVTRSRLLCHTHARASLLRLARARAVCARRRPAAPRRARARRVCRI
jgi:hypothetical protein